MKIKPGQIVSEAAPSDQLGAMEKRLQNLRTELVKLMELFHYPTV